MHTLRLLPLLVWLASSLAYAAPLYKVTDAQGNVTYTAEAPPPAPGLRIETLTPSAQPRDSAVQTTTARERQLQDAAAPVDQQINQRQTQRKEREAKLREAQAALGKARKAYTDGQIAQPGERVGTTQHVRAADGKMLTIKGSRLGDAYFERVKQLEAEVKAAEQAVTTAQKQLRDSP